jgi:transcriptional regulator with XRE-family HTH domain
MMGRGTHDRPKKLGKKLAAIRRHLGVSQDGIVRDLGLSLKVTRNEISKYERGLREPSLSTLVKYARACGVNVEALIDDDLDLPIGKAKKNVIRVVTSPLDLLFDGGSTSDSTPQNFVKKRAQEERNDRLANS